LTADGPSLLEIGDRLSNQPDFKILDINNRK
jgi:hypothetical protein